MERRTVENVSDNESWPENRTPRSNVQTDHDGMSLKDIKLEAPTFDGQLDLQVFLDWTLNMNHYFDGYDMSDERRIRFAKMKSVGQAKQYWTNVEKLMKLRNQERIQTRDEMKMKLWEKYMHMSYKQCPLD